MLLGATGFSLALLSLLIIKGLLTREGFWEPIFYAIDDAGHAFRLLILVLAVWRGGFVERLAIAAFVGFSYMQMVWLAPAGPVVDTWGCLVFTLAWLGVCGWLLTKSPRKWFLYHTAFNFLMALTLAGYLLLAGGWGGTFKHLDVVTVAGIWAWGAEIAIFVGVCTFAKRPRAA